MAEYIKREATIKRIEVVYCADCNSYNGVRCRACGTGDAIDMIEDAPAADVAPVVHSYWEHKITNDGENIGICHNCKYPVSWFWEQAKYCPVCGAKMDGSMPKDGAD